MRKPYIDNIRIICIFLLFPFHAAYIFNNLGETFYINGAPNEFLTAWNICIYPWWMTTLFLLAGMSVKYSLTKRTIKQFLFERTKRLLVPLIFSLLIIIPPQSYFAKLFHCNWAGSYWDFYKSYFKITDLSGLDGYFTPGNTWFILYLFIFSVLFTPILAWCSKKKINLNLKKLPFCFLLLPTLLISITVDVFAPGNKSLLQFALCFLFGYFIFSNDEIQNKIENNALVLGFLWLIFMILRPISHINNSLWNSSFSYFVLHGVTIFGILSLLGLGKKFLNSEFVFTKYFSKANFSLYLIHQTIIVFLGYFLLKKEFSPYLTWVLITISSFTITIIIYQFTLVTKKFCI